MTQISRPLRRRRGGAKRLDLTDLRAVLQDSRLFTRFGRVYVPEGASKHFEIISENGSIDILVDVLLEPRDFDVTCRLGGTGGAKRGAWTIPNPGDEVAVVVPDGEIDWMPIIVAVCSTGEVPAGLAENVTVIADGKVLVHDGDGGTEPLVKKSEFEAHVHTAPGGGGVTTTPNAAITGTTVLEAK